MQLKFNEKSSFLIHANSFKKNEHIHSKIIFDYSTNTNPFITIAIPTFRRPETLKIALDSALNQSDYTNYEVIVVDNDNNTTNKTKSETEKLLRSYKSDKLRYFRNDKNLGMFGNWNRCFEVARGEYVALLHDDDFITKDFLLTTTGYLKKKRTPLLSISHKIVDEKKQIITGQILPTFTKYISLTEKDFYLFHPVSNVATIYNKAILYSEGGFNEDLFPIADYFTNYNIVQKYGGIKILKILGFYRQGFNESSNLNTIYNTIFAFYYFRKQLQQRNNYFLGDFFNKIMFAESIFTSDIDDIITNRESVIKSKKILFIYFIIGKIVIRVKLLFRHNYLKRIG